MCYNPPLVRDKPLGVPASVKLVYTNPVRWHIYVALGEDELIHIL